MKYEAKAAEPESTAWGYVPSQIMRGETLVTMVMATEPQ